MQIYVPSTHRASAVRAGYLRFTSPAALGRTTFVVPEGQSEAYVRALADTPCHVVTCDEPGIAKTRHWIGRHAAERGEETFAMCDDDVWWYRRLNMVSTRLVEATADDVDEMWEMVENLLMVEYAHVGVSAREGNNRFGPADKTDVMVNTRTLRVLCYRTEDFLSVEHGRVDVMEDFDVNLQLLRRGRPNANLVHWSQNQRGGTSAPGGCSTYRSHEVHDRSARRLAELHPDFVRLREKHNKSGGAFGHRTEVTISWKKAFGADL